jgi:hypothetical protein
MFVFTACRRTSGTPLLLILFEWSLSETVLSRQPALMYILSRFRHTDTDVPTDKEGRTEAAGSGVLYLAVVYLTASSVVRLCTQHSVTG